MREVWSQLDPVKSGFALLLPRGFAHGSYAFVSLVSCLNHCHDARSDGFRQLGPRANHSPKVGVIIRYFVPSPRLPPFPWLDLASRIEDNTAKELQEANRGFLSVSGDLAVRRITVRSTAAKEPQTTSASARVVTLMTGALHVHVFTCTMRLGAGRFHLDVIQFAKSTKSTPFAYADARSHFGMIAGYGYSRYQKFTAWD